MILLPVNIRVCVSVCTHVHACVYINRELEIAVMGELPRTTRRKCLWWVFVFTTALFMMG